jgi:hypothetical protein
MENGGKLLSQTACILLKKGADIGPLAETCFRFSPKVAVRGNEAIFIEVGRNRLLQSGQTLIARIETLCRRFGMEAKVVLAADPGTALALARFGEARPGELPLDALPDYADPFGRTQEQLKGLLLAVASLKKLGLKTMADFLGIPAMELGGRFPSELVGTWTKVKEGVEPIWPIFEPAEKIEEQVDMTSEGRGCENLEAMLFFLKMVSDRAMARLAGRGLRLSALEIEMKLEARDDLRAVRLVPFRLPLPQGSVLGLVKLLHERLSSEFQKKPLSSPAEELSLRVLETAPGLQRQTDLFTRREEEKEAFNSLADRLVQKLGRDRVYQAALVERYLPESAWQRTLHELRWPATGKQIQIPFIPNRPLWLLRRPEPLLRHQAVLAGLGDRKWEVVEADIPERLTGEWMLDSGVEGFFRDYYRLACAGGVHLWVFSIPGAQADALPAPRGFFDRPEAKFFLHGFFD